MLHYLILQLSSRDGNPNAFFFMMLPFWFVTKRILPKNRTDAVWMTLFALWGSALLFNFALVRSNGFLFEAIEFVSTIVLWFFLLPTLFYNGQVIMPSFEGTSWIKSIWWWLEYLSAFVAYIVSWLSIDYPPTYSWPGTKLSVILLALWALVLLVVSLKDFSIRRTAKTRRDEGKTPHLPRDINDDGTYPHPPFRQERP